MQVLAVENGRKKLKLVVDEAVVAGSVTSNDLRGPDSSRRVIFNGSKGRSDDGLGGFDSDGDDDEEHKP